MDPTPMFRFKRLSKQDPFDIESAFYVLLLFLFVMAAIMIVAINFARRLRQGNNPKTSDLHHRTTNCVRRVLREICLHPDIVGEFGTSKKQNGNCVDSYRDILSQLAQAQ